MGSSGAPLALALAFALAVPASPAAAAAGERGVPSGADDASPDGGAFLGPEYRWDRMPVLERVLYDVVAIPANVPRWSAGDVATFGFWGAATAALALPGSPSVDVR